MKSFMIGFFAAVLILVGGVVFYLVSGMAPAAATDPPLPFEATVAHMALDAHIRRQELKESLLPADESNLLDGARVYREQCAGCHGLPGEPRPATGATMYPPAPELFKGQGVTDDPVFDSYWKVANGIRLTGMPAFKTRLADMQLWQVGLLVAHANEIPDSVRRVLVPGPTPAARAPSSTPTPPSR